MPTSATTNRGDVSTRARRIATPQRFTFFGGKGGVGKTTCAAAAAARAASEGRQVLVVSTDPAHSLGDALAVKLDSRPRGVSPGLFAVQLDADRALERWLREREDAFRVIADRGTYLDDEDIESLFSLSLPGVDELVGLVELARLARVAAWDEVIVDTAPTGHTLRLLEMPETLHRLADVLDDMQAKHRFLAASLGRGFRPDFADRTIAEIESEATALRSLLVDPLRSAFTWITLPERASLDESIDGIDALERIGIRVSTVVVNRVWPLPARPCPLCSPRVRAEAACKWRASRDFSRARRLEIPAVVPQPIGPRPLEDLARSVRELRAEKPRGARTGAIARGRSTRFRAPFAPPRLRRDRRLELPASLELVLVGGKGGVGKTTVACAMALETATLEPKKRLLLLSTDPAHSLGDVLGRAVSDEAEPLPEGPKNLHVRELDAKGAFRRERERYRRAIDEAFAALFRGHLEPTFDRAVLRDLFELAPPGLDELFALTSIASALDRTRGARGKGYDRVIVDTAPTGHTLRLLALPETALSWVHAVMRILLKYRHVIGLGELAAELTALAGRMRALSALLADPARASFVVVTRPAELPCAETERLVRELRRISIGIGALVVNAVNIPHCARCERASRHERPYVDRLSRLAERARVPAIAVPASYPPPRGAAELRNFYASFGAVE